MTGTANLEPEFLPDPKCSLCIEERARQAEWPPQPGFIPDPKPGWRTGIQVTQEQVNKAEEAKQIKTFPTSEPAFGSTSIQFHKWITAEPQIKIKLEKGQKNTYAWEITLEGLDTNQVIERIQQADKALHEMFGEQTEKMEMVQ